MEDACLRIFFFFVFPFFLVWCLGSGDVCFRVWGSGFESFSFSAEALGYQSPCPRRPLPSSSGLRHTHRCLGPKGVAVQPLWGKYCDAMYPLGPLSPTIPENGLIQVSLLSHRVLSDLGILFVPGLT